MTDIVLTILLVGLIGFLLYHITERIRKQAYQWWYMPWLALVYSGLMYLIYNKTNFPDWFFPRWFYEEYQTEAAFSLICIALWLALQLLLREESVHQALIGPFRNLFAPKRDDKDRVLPFPYFIDEEGVVRSKVGKEFYRWTLKFFILLVTLVYAAFFLLIRFEALTDFYLKSAFGILGLLPLIEYYVYLCAEVPIEKAIIESDGIGRSNFDELWKTYVDTFDNFSVAWKKTSSPEELALARTMGKDNDDDFENLIRDFMDKEKRSDAIIEKYDIVSAFMKLEPIFDYVEKDGRHILVAIDIPNHFTKGQERSFVEDVAVRLSEILQKNFTVYKKESAQTALSNSIVIAPVSLLSRQGMDADWLKKIGLITVVNMFDKGVSNLYECYKFSCVLQTVNKAYQVIFVTPHRRGVEPALKSTWLIRNKMTERQKWLFPGGERQFFIGYDFEGFRERFSQILAAIPSEPLYSGSELAPIALSKRLGKAEKAVTPVHYLDLAYSNAIEGKEELRKFVDHINKAVYQVTKDIVNDHYRNHLSPIDLIVDEQVFTVIYDVENNAPACYTKWEHLGYKENFSIVVSKPYLFRDYFNDNHDYFTLSPFAALQPHMCNSRLTLAIILLYILQRSEMEEEDLRNLLHDYYYENEVISVSGVVRNLFKTYFSGDLGGLLMTHDEVAFRNGEYRHLLKYNLSQLTDANTPSYLDVVTVKDEPGNVLLDLLYDLMYQNYDVGQIHSFLGKPYVIKDFNRSTRTLNVSPMNNPDNDILFYKPIQQVALSEVKTYFKGIEPNPTRWRHPITGEWLSVTFEGYEADVRIKTLKWYQFFEYAANKGFRAIGSSSPERHYPFGKVLKVTFGYLQKPEYRKRIDSIRKSLQILFYEAIQSVFPHHAQYLIVSSSGPGDENLPWIFNQFECSNSTRPGELSFYFIEDAHVDLGLIGALAIDRQNIWYILKYLYDYLIWLTEGGPVSVENGREDDGGESDNNQHSTISEVEPTGYDEYYQRKDFDRLSFLKYGGKTLPEYFDVNLMINFIKDLFQSDKDLLKTSADRQSKNDVTGACDFCGKKMKNKEMQRLQDGRMRCPECSVDAVDTDTQFQELCGKVKEAFKKHLDKDFSSIQHNAKLVSAVELHKLSGDSFSITNGYDVRKILGLAYDTKVDEFYVENGYKPDKTFGIIAHEMTHIWEYNDADFIKVRKANEDLVEGLAVWTDLFLSEKNGATDIEERRRCWLSRQDEYGRGLRFIMKQCPDNPYTYISKQAKNIK